MKNITQLQNELAKNEQLTQADLMNILGGRRRNRNKRHMLINEAAVPNTVSYLAVDANANEAVEDDKRRARPGGGTTTTSPNSLL